MNPASCARPGCANTPAAWLAYDYSARCAWLDDQPDDGTGKIGRWPLCERHANTLRVPRGWFCVDRRGPDVASDAVDLDGSLGRGGPNGGGRRGASPDRAGRNGEAGEADQPDEPGHKRRTSAGRLTAIL